MTGPAVFSPPGELGLILPAAPEGDGSAAALADLCRTAEATGADALWAIDHVFWPVPMVECLTTMAVASTATTHAAVGSCVLQLPLRNAPVVAKQATNLQLLSGGRLILGVGVGSHRGEYGRVGADFSVRGRQLDADLDSLRGIWSEEGRGGWTGAEPYGQVPASPPVPVWIGGSSDAARERAARRGDGWVPLFMGVDDYALGVARLLDRAAEVGRDPAQVTPSIVVVMNVGPAEEATDSGLAWLSRFYGLPAKAFRRHLLAGPPEACAEGIQRYLDAGAHHVAVLVASDTGVVHQFAAVRDALAAHRCPIVLDDLLIGRYGRAGVPG